MEAKVREIISRWEQINSEISSPNILNNQQKYKELCIELNHIKNSYSIAQAYRDLLKEITDVKNLLETTKNHEEKAYYKEIFSENTIKLNALDIQLKKSLIQLDPNDHRNIILEIRAGTGGEEAALFAGELYRMYLKYAERQLWQVEQLSISHAEAGGLKEVICSIKGKDVYGLLKYENGVHRVQRVPTTEATGRIHTSSASVVVLPEVEDFEISINSEDVKVDLFRAGGPGGQSVNTTDSAVRLTHIPSGIVVSCQDERSQLKNKNRAMSVLKSKLFDMELAKKHQNISDRRKLAIKTGDRSDKIRTYNFPQSRITDHRIKVSWYNLFEILSGNIGSMLETIKEEMSKENVI